MYVLPKAMSTVNLRIIGREYRNERFKTISGNAKPAHALLLRSRHALRENGCHQHVVSSTCCP
jgi:hypothetical protein